MFEGLSINTKSQLRFRVWQGIMEELEGDFLTLKEKEDMVKWYSDNLVMGANTLVGKLEEVKENE